MSARGVAAAVLQAGGLTAVGAVVVVSGMVGAPQELRIAPGHADNGAARPADTLHDLFVAHGCWRSDEVVPGRVAGGVLLYAPRLRYSADPRVVHAALEQEVGDRRDRGLGVSAFCPGDRRR